MENLEFYNALRFFDKNVILLAYPGEGHGLRKLPNRKDLTIRMQQFFDHYLMDKPAPEWMTHGVPFIEKKFLLLKRRKRRLDKDKLLNVSCEESRFPTLSPNCHKVWLRSPKSD
jgi:hypothetical protein